MNLRPRSVTVSTHTSAFNAVAFQSSAMPNARMSLCAQSVHYFSFAPRALRTAPSRFLSTIRFGSRPPLIRMSVPSHKSLLVRNVILTHSHPVISRVRLYEVIRWSGLLRCAPMIRSKTRWCKVRSLSRSTIGGVGDTTIPSQGWSTKQSLPGIGLHDPLHGRQACPEFTSFHQGVGQICPREGLFSCRPLPKRGQTCDIPDPPNR